MNKKLIAILTLVMFALTLLPMGAFAGSKNTVGGFVPTVTKADYYDLASIRVTEDSVVGNLKNGVFSIELPSGVKFTASSETAIEAMSIPAVGTVEATLNVLENLTGTTTSQTLTVQLSSVNPLTSATVFNIPLKDIKVETVGTGDIQLTITDVSTGILSSSYTVGRFSTGSAGVKALTTTTTGETKRAAGIGKIRITENTIGALDGETVEIKLPSGMYWMSGMPLVTTGTINGANNMTLTAYTAEEDRKIKFTVNSGTGSAEIFDITPLVYIDDSDAKYGDIIVTFSGTANLDATQLKIGAYADFGITVTADEPKEVLAGRSEVEAADIKIKESIAGSILSGREIKITLPEGVYFYNDGSVAPATPAVPNVKNVKNTILFDAVGSKAAQVFKVNKDFDQIAITVNQLSGSAAEFKVENIKLDVAASFSGDVVAKVTGAAGVEGEVVIATVTKPITVKAEGGTVSIGKQSQEIGAITVVENEAGALIDGQDLVLSLPVGSTWAAVPTVEVVEGDVEIGTVVRSTVGAIANRGLTIPVKTESDVASTIKISNVKISTDRTIAEGDMKFTIDNTSPAAVEFVSTTTTENTLVSVKVATVTTPAEDGVVQPVVMTVGSTVYTIDGVEMTMDVAPYIKDSRTYFPLRHVANAIGISNDNVVWDQNQRTVTIFRANRIVQVTIGSKTMLVNGVPLTMDVAPEITAERTMLPIRFVAQGLGINVDWDDATRTVTLN